MIIALSVADRSDLPQVAGQIDVLNHFKSRAGNHIVLITGVMELESELQNLLDTLDSAWARHPLNLVGKPAGDPILTKMLFVVAAQKIDTAYRQPWLWLPADCVPFDVNFADRLQLDFQNTGKLLGLLRNFRHENEEVEEFETLHPCAVYPSNLYSLCPMVNGADDKAPLEIEAQHEFKRIGIVTQKTFYWEEGCYRFRDGKSCTYARHGKAGDGKLPHGTTMLLGCWDTSAAEWVVKYRSAL